MKHKQAFSLIELMVVISIIAVLATMGVANFAAAIKKSRDSVRKSELAELTQALMMFRADWGSYPNPDTAPVALTTPTTKLEYEDRSTDPPTKRELVPDYIRFMPIDEARASEADHQYTYHCIKAVSVTSGSTTYYQRCVDFSVCAYLEVPQVSGANSTTKQPNDANPCNPNSDSSCKWFCMYSP